MQEKNCQNFVSSCHTSGDDYFNSPEYVSSAFSSAVRAPFVNQIVAGGKKVILTAALAGMLNANLVQPAQAFTPLVSGIGAYVSGEIVSSGTQTVMSGGITSQSKIYIGGIQNVSNGGSAIQTLVSSGGIQNVSSGGYALYTNIYSGGTQNVLNGGSAISGLVWGGGTQNIYAGGSVIYAVISGGGTQALLGNPAVLTSVTISSGGNQNIGYNASAAGLNGVTYNSGAIQNIVSGGILSNFTLGNGLTQNVLNGGLAVSTVISSGGGQNVSSGGFASYTIVSGGGKQILSSGGTTYVTVISSGATQNVSSGGFASYTVVSGGAIHTIFSGGIASAGLVLSGGIQNVLNGGLVRYADVSSGGVQNINGIVGYEGIYGGTQNVLFGGYASSAYISYGGLQNVSSGGSTYYTRIYDTGIQNVSSGGFASYTFVSSGGIQNILWGGRATVTFIENGGLQNVLSGGTASGTYISSGAAQNISNGGSALNANVSSGGIQNVLAGAAANVTMVTGGTQNISNGGSALNTTVYGGIQNILAGAAANSTIVSGGTQNISNGGVVSYTSVYGNGIVNLSSGGRASNTDVSSGGTYNVLQNGSALNTNIYGGIQNVLAGAIANSTFLSGGTMNISSGANVSGVSADDGVINIYNGALVSGIVNVNGSAILDGKISAGVAGLNISGGSWRNTKDSIVTNLVLNGGTINMRNGSAAGNVLTIQNLSASNNPVIEMNVKLGDETSPADKIVVSGVNTGSTLLRVNNAGGLGGRIMPGSGIEVVDATAATGSGTFGLLGGKIDVGEYNYFLQKNAGIYQLITYLGLTDLYKTMANAPLINVFTARSAMTNMEERLGDLRAFGYEQNKQGLWVRAYGKNATVKDLAETDVSFLAFEAGYDRLFNFLGNKLYAGITAGYMNVNEIKTKENEGSQGTGSIPGFGVYASLVGSDSFFADLAIKEIISNLDMTNYAADGITALNFQPKRNILAITLEGGKTFKKELQGSYFRIEPKAGILFMNAGSGSAKVENGVGDLEYDGANYLTAKAGIILGFVKTAKGKATIEPLIELSYLQELLGKGKIRYGAEEHESDLSGSSVEIAAGLNAKLSEKIRLYGQVSYESGDKIKGAGVNVGAQYSF